MSRHASAILPGVLQIGRCPSCGTTELGPDATLFAWCWWCERAPITTDPATGNHKWFPRSICPAVRAIEQHLRRPMYGKRRGICFARAFNYASRAHLTPMDTSPARQQILYDG